MFEDGQGISEFGLAKSAVVAVLSPAGTFVKFEIGSGGLKVDVEQLEIAAVGEFYSELLAAEFGDVEVTVELSTGDDGATFARVVAVVALAVEEGFDDSLDLISVRDFLQEDDVRLEIFHSNDGVSIASAV